MTYCTPDIFEGDIHRLFIYMNVDIIPVVINRRQKHSQNLEVIMAYY